MGVAFSQNELNRQGKMPLYRQISCILNTWDDSSSGFCLTELFVSHVKKRTITHLPDCHFQRKYQIHHFQCFYYRPDFHSLQLGCGSRHYFLKKKDNYDHHTRPTDRQLHGYRREEVMVGQIMRASFCMVL